MGRSLVVDVTLPKNIDGYRYVDHRNIEWLIVDGVRYEVGRKPVNEKPSKWTESVQVGDYFSQPIDFQVVGYDHRLLDGRE